MHSNLIVEHQVKLEQLDDERRYAARMRLRNQPRTITANRLERPGPLAILRQLLRQAVKQAANVL